MEYLFEVSVQVDDDEVPDPEAVRARELDIRRAIESLDPAIGVFIVENRM